jgi:hypothetical protein
MRKLSLVGATILGAAVISATPISVHWTTQKTLSVSLDKAHAVVGRPLTPGSVSLGLTGGTIGGRCGAARRV